MKILYIGVVVLALSIVVPVSAQQIQSTQSTEANSQQGRVLLDSDASVSNGSSSDSGSESGSQYNETDSEFINERAEECWNNPTLETPGSFEQNTRVSCDDPTCNEGPCTKSGEEDTSSHTPEWTSPSESDPGNTEEPTFEATQSGSGAFGVEREMKESGEKAGTEDINIGVGELQEMNKADLIANLSTEPVETRAIYVKLGDIKGESDDSGSQAKKPKEIVVVGSKVRGWDPKKKEAIVGRAGKSPEEVETSDDLALYMTAIVDTDARMEEVTFNYSKIEFSYDTEFKLLGFIPMSLPSVISIDSAGASEEYGKVKVKFPWYHVFGSKSVDAEAVTNAEVEIKNDNEHTDVAIRLQAVADVLLGR